MVDLRNELENNRIFIGLISLFSLLRLYLGMKMPIWLFPNAIHDDMLMFEYSNLYVHFTNWNIQSLTKDITYPIFLFFVKLSHTPYRFWLSLFWIIAAILVIYAIYKYLTDDRLVILCSFLFVLFLPVGFDILCGQRVYRNGIMAPTAIIFLSMLYIFINNLLESTVDIKNTVMWGILAGLTFTFNYYIKEDGMMTLPILVVCILAILIFKLYEERKLSFSKDWRRYVKLSIICILPLIIFMAGTITYQEVNNHYFGVSDVNTRTSGELGEFYANLLKIDDPNKSTRVWIPASTVEKAVDASPTLQSHPEFINTWMNTPWGSGILKNSTIPGDLTEWSLRFALNNSDMYKDEKSTSDFFSKVNDELDSAFASGQLQKSDEIFITSSANGKNMSEIMALTPYVLSGMDMTFFYHGMEFNNVNHSQSSLMVSNNVTKNVSRDISDNLAKQSEIDNSSGIDLIAMKLIYMDVGIYQVVSYIISLLAFAGFVLLCINQLKNRFRNRKMNMLLLYCIMLFGTVLVQIFAVSWFCSYLATNPWVGSMDDLTTHIKFHLASAYGFFTLFVVLSIAGAYTIIENYRLDKNPSDSVKPAISSPAKIEKHVPREPVYEEKEFSEIDIDSIDPEIIEEIIREIRMEEQNKD